MNNEKVVIPIDRDAYYSFLASINNLVHAGKLDKKVYTEAVILSTHDDHINKIPKNVLPFDVATKDMYIKMLSMNRPEFIGDIIIENPCNCWFCRLKRFVGIK